MIKAVSIAAFALLASCASSGPVVSIDTGAPDWRRVATPADRARLREWRTAFMAGLTQARAAGHAAEIMREGPLLQPDAGLVRRPPAGDYRCRVIKLGRKGAGGLAYVSYPSFMCRIDDEGGVASFKKLTGSQRPVGVILGNAQKTVFLGTLVMGDERLPLDYGRDRERDMIGAVEALPDGRWRLILPYPHFESLIDVIELVPAGTSRL